MGDNVMMFVHSSEKHTRHYRFLKINPASDFSQCSQGFWHNNDIISFAGDIINDISGIDYVVSVLWKLGQN